MASLIYWKLNSQMAQILFKKCEWRSNINDILKAFDDFEKKQKSVWINVFWYIEVFIFWNCIQYTIYWSKTQMLKKNFLWMNYTVQKLPFFFLRELQLITVLLFTCDFYMSWNTKFASLQLCGICVSSSSPKTDLLTIFLNLQIRSVFLSNF